MDYVINIQRYEIYTSGWAQSFELGGTLQLLDLPSPP